VGASAWSNCNEAVSFQTRLRPLFLTASLAFALVSGLAGARAATLNGPVSQLSWLVGNWRCDPDEGSGAPESESFRVGAGGYALLEQLTLPLTKTAARRLAASQVHLSGAVGFGSGQFIERLQGSSRGFSGSIELEGSDVAASVDRLDLGGTMTLEVNGSPSTLSYRVLRKRIDAQDYTKLESVGRWDDRPPVSLTCHRV